jgi:hypothetical protein
MNNKDKDNEKNKNNADDFINGIIKETIETAEFKQAMATIPSMISVVKTMYDEMKKQGFSDVQSYDFSKSYMLMTIANGGK